MSNNSEKNKKLEIQISLELPFWVNLRKGYYKFSHRDILKEKLAENGLETGLNEDYVDCTLFIDNFRWKIGFDHFKKFEDINAQYIMVSEDFKNQTLINDMDLEEYFGEHKDNAFFQKLKTVIRRTYNIMLSFKEGIEKTEKEIVEKFAEPIKIDFLKSINEFLEIYIGYFSTKSYCNDAYLLGGSVFSYDKVDVRIRLDDEDISDKVGFPTMVYSSPYYPTVFPQLDKESKFFDFLNNNRYPSFTKILKGLSNHYFIHGDTRIGVLYLDIALESSINDFIKYYNKNQSNPEEKIRKIKKNHTIGDFLKDDLPNILENHLEINDNLSIEDLIQFHEERNLILHRKKRKLNESNINQLRESVIILIREFEKYMDLPYIIENQNTDFASNTIGRAMENIPGGSWGKVKLYNSFLEMAQDTKRN